MATTTVPDIRVDTVSNTVTITGTVEWRNVQDGLFLARTVTDYTIVLTLEGSPWDAGFTAPDLQPGDFTYLTGPTSILVGDPKTNTSTDSANGLEAAYVANTPAQVAQGYPAFTLIVEPFTRIYAGGPLDGDQTFQAFIAFNAAFDRIDAVTVAMEVRLPVAGTDFFTTEYYAGENDFADRDISQAGGQTGTDDPETLAGTADPDEIDGGGGNDRVSGLAGNDTLSGGAGNDTVEGGGGNDLIAGGTGRDTVTGGAGNDDFAFLATAESAGRKRDTVTDFRSGRDDIDLSAIDADTGTAGDQDFVFIGDASFSAAGQVRFANGILSASTDYDAAAEFTLLLDGATRFVANDLIG